VVLLDTHVWVWMAEGDARRIGRRTRQLLARAESRGLVRLSPVSVFEVTALHTLGRLRLAMPIESWVRQALDAAAIKIAPVSVDVAVDAGTISREALADPFDRLLVATARNGRGAIVTADARILDYAAATTAVRVHDARK
jgi:PIN domain nuclease of toxin-antitoxin system